MLKLLYITNGITGAGGLERVLSIKASLLAEEYGYEVKILSLNEKDKSPFYCFSKKVSFESIRVTGAAPAYIRSYFNGIRKVVKTFRPDVISVCDDGLKGFFLSLVFGSGIPVIYERHVSREIEKTQNRSWLNRIKAGVKWMLMEKLGSRFSRFVVLTKGNKKEWTSLKNLVVIPNPLSFYPEESSPLKNKKIIAVGRHSFQKGYDRLLNSWQLVKSESNDWQLSIYGKEDPLINLKKQAEDLQIGNSVSFFPPEKDIQSKYLESSILVMSSRFEGFGMVLAEAMACGVPCISFDCNYGPSDIIKDGVDGFIVPEADVNALAEKIKKLMQDENLRCTMGVKAKTNIKRYLPQSIVKEWDMLFKELTGK